MAGYVEGAVSDTLEGIWLWRDGDAIIGVRSRGVPPGRAEPEELPRRLQRLANDPMVTVGASDRTVEVGANGAAVYRIVLTGRATSVPFTTVMTGSQRTPTDNTEAASTCTVPYLTRPRSCSNRLCKQEVVAPTL